MCEPLHGPVCAHTEYIPCAQLPGCQDPRSQPEPASVVEPALCCAWPPGLLHCVQCTPNVGIEPSHCSHLAGPGYGSQPRGELAFAKLDNRLVCQRIGAVPPRAAAGAGPGPPCQAAGRKGLAAAGAGGWPSWGWTGGPGPVLPIGCLGLPPRLPPEPAAPPASASPAASKLPKQAPPAEPCRAVTGLEWPLPWTCPKSSSPCWSTLCLGQRRGQVGTEVARLGWLPRCPRGGGSHRHGSRRGISKLGRVPSRGLPLAPSWAKKGGSATATQGLPPGSALGSQVQRVATDRCCAHMGQGQDQRALLRECTGC